eukprot:scaffold1885_cov402-Prasinococcus_capsulatus_cf.AAC.13
MVRCRGQTVGRVEQVRTLPHLRDVCIMEASGTRLFKELREIQKEKEKMARRGEEEDIALLPNEQSIYLWRALGGRATNLGSPTGGPWETRRGQVQAQDNVLGAVPPRATQGRVRDQGLPPQRALQDGRDLPGHPQDRLEPGLDAAIGADCVHAAGPHFGPRAAHGVAAS